MKEFQFKIPDGVWVDVHAETAGEAVELLNSQLHLLDEPLPAPGLLRRIQIDARRPVTIGEIAAVFDLKTGEVT